MIPIYNCKAVIEKPCPKEWDRLAATDDALIRFCDACEKQVFYCEDDMEALQHAIAGRCIAMPAEEKRRQPRERIARELDFPLMLGQPSPRYSVRAVRDDDEPER